MSNTRTSLTASLLVVAFLALGGLSVAADGAETAHRSGEVASACGISTQMETPDANEMCDVVLTSRRPPTWSMGITPSDIVTRRWQDHTPDGAWSPS